MPLKSSGIVKSGNLLKSPPLDAKGRSSRKWHIRYFVLYDPNRIVERTGSNASKRSFGSDEELRVITPSPPTSSSFSHNRRRKSSIAENILQRFRQNQVHRDTRVVDTVTLFYFESVEKEMKGAPPKSKK